MFLQRFAFTYQALTKDPTDADAMAAIDVR
jgi:hypothetical protein